LRAATAHDGLVARVFLVLAQQMDGEMHERVEPEQRAKGFGDEPRPKIAAPHMRELMNQDPVLLLCGETLRKIGGQEYFRV